MNEMLIASPEGDINKKELEREAPSTDELERTSEAVKGEDPSFVRYRQAMVEAREELDKVRDPEVLNTMLHNALDSYVQSIEDMNERKKDSTDIELGNKRVELSRLQSELARVQGRPSESQIRRKIATLVQEMGHLANESKEKHELKRAAAHDHLAGLIFEACEKGGTFRMIDNAEELRGILSDLRRDSEAALLQAAIEDGVIAKNDSISITRDKLKDSQAYSALPGLIDAVSLKFTRDRLSNAVHATKLGGGEIHAIKTKAGQLIQAAYSYFKKRVIRESEQHSNTSEQEAA